jgi:hypothetical protein
MQPRLHARTGADCRRFSAAHRLDADCRLCRRTKHDRVQCAPPRPRGWPSENECSTNPEEAARLTGAAERAGNDYLLREALATRDPVSMIGALRRHGERTGAEVAMLVGPGGQVLADATSAAGRPAERARRRIPTSTRGDPVPGIGLVGESAVQFVTIQSAPPHQAPGLCSGDPLDARLLSRLARLTSLEVSLGTRASDGHWRVHQCVRGRPRAARVRIRAQAQRHLPFGNPLHRLTKNGRDRSLCFDVTRSRKSHSCWSDR